MSESEFPQPPKNEDIDREELDSIESEVIDESELSGEASMEHRNGEDSDSEHEHEHEHEYEEDAAVAADNEQVEEKEEEEEVAAVPSATWVAPSGRGNLLRQDSGGNTIVDAVSGRSSLLGLNCPSIFESIRSSIGDYLGDGSCFPSSSPFEASASGGTEVGLRTAMAEFLGSSVGELCDNLFLTPSPDLAIETAIQLARRRRPDRAYRTVALVGSDHGRTALCRTASGRPELHEDLGPLVAGFTHVPVGDVQALDVAVDEQTACVLISPILWNRGGEPLEESYLNELRRICDQRGVLVVVDETQVVFGSTGHPLVISSIADVRPDIVALSSGLFAGLPGGITLASPRAGGEGQEHADRYPLLASVVTSTLEMADERGVLDSVKSVSDSFAVELAERVSRFEFVRDVHVTGLSIGLETDLNSNQLVKAARQRQLHIETAGDTAIRLQPPLVLDEADRQLLLEAMEATLSSIQLETADLSA